MSLIIRSKDINQINNKININLSESIPYLNVLLMKNNNLNQKVIDIKSNIILYLKLLDLENNIVNDGNFNYTILTNQGIGYFKDIKINQIGDYKLLVQDINNNYKSDFIYLTVKSEIITYSINLLRGNNRILKYNSEIYIFNIVNQKQQMVTSFNLNNLIPLNLSISYFLESNPDKEEFINLNIKPDKNGYYNFKFSSSEKMVLKIHLNMDTSNFVDNIVVSDYHFNIHIIDYINNNHLIKYPYINEKNSTYRIHNLFSNLDYGLSEDIYTRRKSWVNNQLFRNRPTNKQVNFETNLSCSEQLNYTLKKPQELFSIPKRVDNSIGSTVIGIPFFYPKSVLNNL